MPVNYGLLRGAVINDMPYQSGTDHYQIEVKADDLYRIAVDVYSALAGATLNFPHNGSNVLATDRMVMYYKNENFTHPLTAELLKTNTGFTLKSDLPQSLCLDYLRTTPALFPLQNMKVVAPKANGNKGEDLNDDIGPWVKKALNNPDAEVFAFGAGWDDSTSGKQIDSHAYFNPDPLKGIHDIHMNQGDTGTEAKANGTYQDGALFFYFKTENLWVAMFFRFQNQHTSTDDNGNAN